MAKFVKLYNPEDPKDAEILLQLMMESDEEEKGIEFDDESDTDVDFVEERNEDSATEQDCSSSEDSFSCEEIDEHYVGKDKITKWKKTKYAQRVKRRPQNIIVRLPGVIGPAKQAKTILECWNCLVSNDILENVVQYTNQYIETIRLQYTRERDCQYTDLIEIKAFIGLLYLAGALHSNRQSLEELWGDDGFGVEIFRLVMNLKRFKFILRCIRFDDRTTREERKHIDKLCAIRQIFTIFVENIKKNYSPGSYVTIDEMLVGFRGRCSFRQYIPSKPNKYGIKIFAVVDAKTWYTYNLEIYPGRQPEGEYQMSYKPTDVVKRLVEPIYNTGRNITADNWFTDIPLVDYLQTKKLSYVGTIKKNKRQLPLNFVATKGRQERTSLFGFQKEATIVSYIPKKGKNVILVSSMHFDDAIDESTGDNKKPDMITFYNQTKSGVDLVDKMCASFNVQRNTRRWPLVTFFSMLNISGINAQVLYAGNGNDVKKRRVFLKQLSRELVAEHLNRRATKNRGFPFALKQKLEKIAPTGELETENIEPTISTNKRKRCAPCVANKKQRYSKYLCKLCKQFLCLEHATIVCGNCFGSKIDAHETDEEQLD